MIKFATVSYLLLFSLYIVLLHTEEMPQSWLYTHTSDLIEWYTLINVFNFNQYKIYMYRGFQIQCVLNKHLPFFFCPDIRYIACKMTCLYFVERQIRAKKN